MHIYVLFLLSEAVSNITGHRENCRRAIYSAVNDPTNPTGAIEFVPVWSVGEIPGVRINSDPENTIPMPEKTSIQEIGNGKRSPTSKINLRPR